MSKTIGESTIKEMADRARADTAKGIEMGMFTPAGAAFAVDIISAVEKSAEASGLQAGEFAILLHSVAEITLTLQGALDMHGKDRREGSKASMAYLMKMMEAIGTLAEIRAKKEGKGGSTDASFADFDPASNNPPVFN